MALASKRLFLTNVMVVESPLETNYPKNKTTEQKITDKPINQ